MKANPPCIAVYAWLQIHFGRHCLAPLTGTDHKALAAAAQILALYAYDSSPEVIEAFGKVVRRMQPTTQRFAFHAIAHGIEWSQRERIWAEAGLPAMPPAECAFRGRW